MIPGIEVDAAVMRRAAEEGFSTTTDLADYLVKKGLPFRDAHEAVAHAVREAATRGCDLADLPLAQLQSFAPQIGADVYEVLRVDGSVAARSHLGGTAPLQVEAQVGRWRALLAAR
jgi:argininosuccinate lyase